MVRRFRFPLAHSWRAVLPRFVRDLVVIPDQLRNEGKTVGGRRAAWQRRRLSANIFLRQRLGLRRRTWIGNTAAQLHRSKRLGKVAGKVTSTTGAFRRGDFLFGKLRPSSQSGRATSRWHLLYRIVVGRASKPIGARTCDRLHLQRQFVHTRTEKSTGTKMPRTSCTEWRAIDALWPTRDIVSEFENILLQ